MRSFMILSLLCLGGCNVLGSPTLDFNQLGGTLTQDQAMALTPELDWQCTPTDAASAASMGQTFCDGMGRELNGVPLSHLDHFFRDGTLSFTMVELNPSAFAALAAHMDSKYQRLPKDARLESARGNLRGELTGWQTQGGIALASATDKNPNGNLLLLWIAKKEFARRGAAY